MSNLSEEEILDDINFCLEGEYITPEHYEAIQGLLDLYKQNEESCTKYLAEIGQLRTKLHAEKEKNKDKYWEGYIQKQNESMEICKMCKYRKKVREYENQMDLDYVDENYVRKDKIREKIKEWDKGIAWANADDHYYAIKILKEILEEE